MPARHFCLKTVMKKKYICRFSATNILVKVRNVVKRLEFEPDVISDYGLRGSSYITDDKEIQSAVEHHPQFRTGQRDAITIYGESFERPIVVPSVEDKSVVEDKPVVRKRKAKKEE